MLYLQMSERQNILEVISAVTKDLRHTESFRGLLHPLDDETARRVANAHIDFLYRTLEIDPWLGFAGCRQQRPHWNSRGRGRVQLGLSTRHAPAGL